MEDDKQSGENSAKEIPEDYGDEYRPVDNISKEQILNGRCGYCDCTDIYTMCPFKLWS